MSDAKPGARTEVRNESWIEAGLEDGAFNIVDAVYAEKA